jgi:HEXXH motif-containing protein
MIPPPHTLSEEDFTALARGGGGATVVRALAAARRSRTLLLIRFIVDATDSDTTRRAFRVLAEAHRVAPEPVGRVLDHPTVGVWATRTAQWLFRGSLGATPRPLASPPRTDGLVRVAVAAAVRAGLRTSLPVAAADPVPLPSLGVLHVTAPGELVVRPRTGGVDIGTTARIPSDPYLPGPNWRPLDRVAVGGATFLLDRWEGEKLPPDMAVSDSVDVPAWREQLAQGWDMLVRTHPEVAQELRAAVTVLTPLRTPPDGISSATVANAFGCLFLSLPSDARTTAVTLAHEMQHTKLIALMDLFPLLDTNSTERFYAPWRNDPRPLVGLLHGTYAYLGVANFWRRRRRQETFADARMFAEVEFVRWRDSAREATQTMLGSGRLTSIGERFVRGMRDVLDEWCVEPVSDAALARAAHLSDEHYARWRAAYVDTGKPQ